MCIRDRWTKHSWGFETNHNVHCHWMVAGNNLNQSRPATNIQLKSMSHWKANSRHYGISSQHHLRIVAAFSINVGARQGQGQASRQTGRQTSRQTSRQTNMQTIVLCQVNHSLKNCCERYTILPALNFKLASCLNNVLLPAHSSFTLSSVNWSMQR